MALHQLSSIYHQLLKDQIPNPLYIARTILEKDLSLDDILAELKRGVPFERLIQQVDFFGAVFEITPHVLIPRPETELIVVAVSEAMEKDQRQQIRLLDICTGSGCMGISLKKSRPGIQLFASDISQDALDCAEANAVRLGASGDFRCGSLLEPWADCRFDVIVCNPPYISLSHYHQLDAAVRDYEPMIALTDHQDGLSFYRTLACQLKDYLNPRGYFFAEIGYDQGAAVKEIFEASGWNNTTVGQDLSGHDRWIHLQRD